MSISIVFLYLLRLRFKGTNEKAMAARMPGIANERKFICAVKLSETRMPPNVGPMIPPILPIPEAKPMAVERINEG